MAKNDSDLFDRLRQAGLRKQAAKALSGIGEGASKNALRAARSAIRELRSLADELERRLPGATPDASATGKSAGRTGTRSPAATPRASRSRAAGADQRRRAQRTAGKRNSPAAPRSRTAAAAPASDARAPRGQNKAKILESLKADPKTASEIANETGIGTGTVGSTLSKLAMAGDVVKADRGYALPK
jgi:DprA winged helix domain